MAGEPHRESAEGVGGGERLRPRCVGRLVPADDVRIRRRADEVTGKHGALGVERARRAHALAASIAALFFIRERRASTRGWDGTVPSNRNDASCPTVTGSKR